MLTLVLVDFKMTKGSDFEITSSQFWSFLAISNLFWSLPVNFGHFRSVRNKSIHSKPIADAYKLYAHFLIVENSGLVGIPITIFVYLVETILASSIFYVYFLKIHNNGRLLDTYHRLHGAEEDFLVPYDQEISAKVWFFVFFMNLTLISGLSPTVIFGNKIPKMFLVTSKVPKNLREIKNMILIGHSVFLSGFCFRDLPIRVERFC